MLKWSTFDCSSKDKYQELKNFRLEVNNIFQLYNINYAERVQGIKNWLCSQDLQFLEALSQAVQEECKVVEGLFETLHSRFRPKHKEAILSLQYCKH